MSEQRTTAQPVMARAFHEVRELIQQAGSPSEIGAYVHAQNPDWADGYRQALFDLDEAIEQLLKRSRLPDYVTKPCCTEREHAALAAYREVAARAKEAEHTGDILLALIDIEG